MTIDRDLMKERDSMKENGATKPPRLGLDLDGTISEARVDLDRYGLKYEELILVDSFDGKADVIVEKKITVYFDDQPEMLKNIPAGVQVMLCRNEGNFNFDEQKWIMSRITGKLV